jgi:hypothetical protein
LTLAFLAGAKYDQRPRERYPAINGQAIFQVSRFLIRAEAYTKYVLDYGGAWQTAMYAQTSILLIPRWLMLAADVGGFFAQPFQPATGDPIPDFDSAFRRPLDKFQWRVALHWYWFRNIGMLSLMFRETHLEENPDRAQDNILEREMRLEAQFRF